MVILYSPKWLPRIEEKKTANLRNPAINCGMKRANYPMVSCSLWDTSSKQFGEHPTPTESTPEYVVWRVHELKNCSTWHNQTWRNTLAIPKDDRHTCLHETPLKQPPMHKADMPVPWMVWDMTCVLFQLAPSDSKTPGLVGLCEASLRPKQLLPVGLRLATLDS